MSQVQDQPIVPYPAPPPEARSSTGKVSLEIEITENDLRARQFACHLRVVNNADTAINLLAINYRLGSGVTVEKTENTSSVDLKLEYDQLRDEVRLILRSLYITSSEAFRNEYAKSYLEGLRDNFRFKNFMMVYFYLASGRFRTVTRQALQALQRMDFPITSAEIAHTIFSRLENTQQPDFSIIKEIALAKIDRMAVIEAIDPNFLKPQYLTQILAGETYEQVVILKARRKLSSIVSYAIAFEAKITDAATSGRPVERMLSRSASFDVTPSPLTLSVFAAVFAFLGTVLNNIGLESSAKLSGGSVVGASSQAFGRLFTQGFWENCIVAVILSVVVYNSFELTEFKDRLRTISWRSAMFIGLLCGLLSDRMLKAITSFVG